MLKDIASKLLAWLSSLPTEYQFALVTLVIMQVCFFSTVLSSVLDKNLDGILTALGSLALGAIAHGAVVRGKGNCKDLIGNVPDDEHKDDVH